MFEGSSLVDMVFGVSFLSEISTSNESVLVFKSDTFGSLGLSSLMTSLSVKFEFKISS